MLVMLVMLRDVDDMVVDVGLTMLLYAYDGPICCNARKRKRKI